MKSIVVTKKNWRLFQTNFYRKYSSTYSDKSVISVSCSLTLLQLFLDLRILQFKFCLNLKQAELTHRLLAILQNFDILK